MADDYALFAISEIFCILCCCRTVKEAAESVNNNPPTRSKLSKSEQYNNYIY